MINEIAVRCKISPKFAEILYNRGLQTVEEVKDYLEPKEDRVFDPSLFFEMETAVEVVKKHIENKGKILIYGDYDVDGIFGTFILRKSLEHYRDVFVYLPLRNIGTRGLNKEFCDGMINNGITLLLTVDNCINDFDMINYLKNNGIDVVVTDHHECNGLKPPADAVLDPVLKDSGYPYDGLSGSGVAYKLGLKLTENESYNDEVLPLVAVATIADYMPLTRENRYLVKKGMEGVLKNRSLASLYTKAGGKTLKKAKDLSFYMINIINSCGRISDPKFAYELLAESNSGLYLIEDSCNKLLAFDDERKRKRTEALIEIENGRGLVFENDNFIITLHENILPGILGLIPINLMSKTGKNVISLRKNNVNGEKIYSGSARGIGNCDFLNEVKKLGDKLISIGGHRNSFGMAIKQENLLELIRVLQGITLIEETREELYYDAEMKLGDIDNKIKKELLMMEPTGNGNPEARLLIKEVTFKNISQYNNMTTCQISDEIMYKNAKFDGKLEIKKDWSYDVVVDEEMNILDYKENRLIPRSYETGIDRRDLGVLGVTESKKKELEKKKIVNVDDILCRMPMRYIDTRIPYQVKDVKKMQQEGNCPKHLSMIGTIQNITHSSKVKVICECVDDRGDVFYVGWFYDWIEKSLYVGMRMLFTGSVRFWQREIMLSPNGLKLCGKDVESLKRIHPIYTVGSAPSNEYFESRIVTALEITNKEDYLEKELIEKYGLSLRKDAFRMIHLPSDMNDIEDGAYRIGFDKMFKLAYEMAIKKENENSETYPVFKPKKTFESFRKIIPYVLTKDQEDTIKQIIEICGKGEGLNGLLQADVGYGKTIIAIYLSLLAASNGYQSVVMTPTEILAKQHYEEFSKRLNSFGIKVELITSKKTPKQKRELQERIKRKETMVIIGTNAVLNYDYSDLGVLICDEEHKFGVKHKEKIGDEIKNVHYLSLTATPIPRTIAETFYGGMQLFWLKEKPGNRPDIITTISRGEDESNQKIIEEINKGHQVFIACPAIEKGIWAEENEVATVREIEGKIKKLFKDNKINKEVVALSGKTKDEEVSEIMEKFKEGKISVIVATTVIEVGIDVPNATLMVIKNSERLGIAQLHQLRGRVGRGDEQSYCILEPNEENETRTLIVASTLDGEKIAIEDAKNRGYGNLLGEEQSGKGMNEVISLILKNEALFKDIKNDIDEIISDPERKEFYKVLVE